MQNSTGESQQVVVTCQCKNKHSSIVSLAYLVVYTVIAISWIMGMVLAKGFWSCVFAYCFPPYSLYLVIERAMLIYLGPAWA